MKIKRWKGRVCWSKTAHFARAIGVKGHIKAEGKTRIAVEWEGGFIWDTEILDKVRYRSFIRLRGEA